MWLPFRKRDKVLIWARYVLNKHPDSNGANSIIFDDFKYEDETLILKQDVLVGLEVYTKELGKLVKVYLFKDRVMRFNEGRWYPHLKKLVAEVKEIENRKFKPLKEL